MAIVIETGAIVAGANSYVSLVDVDAWFLQRELTDWTAASSGVKEAAIVIGQMAMDAKYQSLYFGYPVSRSQNMAWPRSRTPYDKDNVLATREPLIDRNGFEWAITEIPTAVKNAAYEAIRVEFEGTFTPTTLSRDDYIQTKTLDVLSTTWFNSAPAIKTHLLVDQLLYPVSDSGSTQSITMRIDTLPWETSSAYYDSAYSLHSWSGDGSYSSFGGWAPYRDLCEYFYRIKGY